RPALAVVWGWVGDGWRGQSAAGRVLLPGRGIARAPPRSYLFIASTPPMISDSSVVIWLWRARLYCMVSALTILSALSVALFIATMRDTCSLVVASVNVWKKDVLTVSGSSSASSSRTDGEKS